MNSGYDHQHYINKVIIIIITIIIIFMLLLSFL